MSSRLNQSLNAEIELHSVEKGSLGGISVRLAGPDAFERAGLARSFELTKIKFEPTRLPNGTAVIKLSSREPIREPFLNFLVEVNWPKGRMLRQYSLLLDPPVVYPEKVAERSAQASRAAAEPTLSASSGAPGPGPGPAHAVTSKSGVISRGRATGKVESGQYGPVQPQDTLWSIAARLRYPAAEMPQMVMALQQANPDAFGEGNINYLKKGSILRIPAEADVMALDPTQARSDFNRRMGRGGAVAAGGGAQSERVAAKPRKPKKAPEPTPTREPVPGGEGAATATAATKPSVPDGELKIAAVEPGDTKVGEATSKKGEAARLKQELTAAQEAAISAKQEGDELKSRLALLEDQIKDMRRLINLKDDQLAQLQAAVGGAEPPPAEVKTPVETKPPVEKTPVVEKPPVEVKAPVEMPVAEKPPMEIKPPVETTPVEVKPPVETAPVAEKPPVEVKPPVEAPPAEVKPPEEKKPPVAEKPAEPPKPKKPVEIVEVGSDSGVMGMVDDTLALLMENAIYIGGGMAAFVVLLGAMVFIRRRRAGDDEGQESILTNTNGDGMDREGPMSGLTTEETSFLDNLSTTGGFTTTLSSSDDSEADETSFLSDFVPSDVEALQEDTGEVDPLAEADVYIAYGRYKQAEELIRQALDKSPGNHALRYKLFEIFHASKESDAFERAIREAQTAGMEVGDPSGWQKVLAMRSDLGKGGAGAKPAAAPVGLDDDLDLGDLGMDDLSEGLGDLDISGVGEETVPSAGLAAAEEEDDDGLGGLGFDLDLTGLGGGEQQSTEQKPASALDDEGEMDLSDLLGDLDVTGLGTGAKPSAAAPAAAKPKAAEPEEDSFDLDLGLDLDLGGDLPSTKTGATAELMSGLDSDEGDHEDFGLDLSLGGLGSGIPDLGAQISGEPGEADGLEVTGLTKPSAGSGGGIGEVLEFDLDASLAADSAALGGGAGGGAAAASDVDEGEVETKIDLARAYIDMGDAEGARDILNEVLQEGTAAQKTEAQKLIASL